LGQPLAASVELFLQSWVDFSDPAGELGDARILTTIEHGETLAVLQRDGPIRANPSSRA